jgi:hypothetical protein
MHIGGSIIATRDEKDNWETMWAMYLIILWTLCGTFCEVLGIRAVGRMIEEWIVSPMDAQSSRERKGQGLSEEWLMVPVSVPTEDKE